MRAALAVLLAITGCSHERPLGDREQGGQPTVVSLNPCTDAIAAELTGPQQLLALSHYSHDPSASSIDPVLARQFPVTGGTVEEILALGPDVVVADVFMQPATRRALEAVGIDVVVFDIATDVDSSRQQVRRMAQLLGAQEAGDALIARIDTALTRLRDGARGNGQTAILWQPGGLVAGEDALVSELLRAAGYTVHPRARDLGQGGYLPLEVVLSDPPDVLILAGDTRGQQHEALARIPQMQRAEFNSVLLYCGGPSIIRSAERLAEIRDAAT